MVGASDGTPPPRRTAREPVPGQASDVWPPDGAEVHLGSRWELRADDEGNVALVNVALADAAQVTGPARVSRAGWIVYAILFAVTIGGPIILLAATGRLGELIDGSAGTNGVIVVAIFASLPLLLLGFLVLGMYHTTSGWTMVDAEGIHHMKGRRRRRTLAWADIDEICLVDDHGHRSRIRGIHVYLRGQRLPVLVTWLGMTTARRTRLPGVPHELAAVASTWWAQGWVPPHVRYRESIAALLKERGEDPDLARPPHPGRA